MMSALVLQMVHAIAHLPLPDILDEDMSKEDQQVQHQVRTFLRNWLKTLKIFNMQMRVAEIFINQC